MARVYIRDEDRAITDPGDVQAFLSGCGIEYDQTSGIDVAPDAPPETLLSAYREKIDDLKARGGYVTADVIDVWPHTPNLDAMLKKFSSEHWHDEDEVRVIVDGRGLFHIHPTDKAVFSIEVEAGDLIRVPKGTHHWFDLCVDRRIRAIRLFQDVSGWTPHYTQSGIDQAFQPVCFGPAYLPPSGPQF
jgi:1,2-dihydroxy-3-keto-5-methylthiopentene dioxygenase